MPRRLIRKYLPTAEEMQRSAAMRLLGRWLGAHDLWHMTRRSLRVAVGIGTFCAFIPLPAQMPLAAIGAIVFRCNLPLAVAMPWITNPVTLVPALYITYMVGTLVLGVEPGAIEYTSAFVAEQYRILFVGSVVVGAVLGLALAMTLDIAWRMFVARRWRRRLRSRRLAAIALPVRNVETPQP